MFSVVIQKRIHHQERISLAFIMMGLLLSFGCSDYYNLSLRNTSPSLNLSGESLPFRVEFSHFSTDSTKIRILLSSNDLEYKTIDSDKNHISRLEVQFQVALADDPSKVVIKNKLQITDTVASISKHIIENQIIIPLKTGNQYIVYIHLLDLNSRQVSENSFLCKKMSTEGIHSFAFSTGKSMNNGILIYQQDIEAISVVTNHEPTLQASFHPLPNFFPPLPFDTQTETPAILLDSTSTNRILILQDGKISIPYQGDSLVLIQNSEHTDGFMALPVWPEFPDLPANDLLLKPLIYITNSEEYHSLFQLQYPDLALERFWTKTGGNPDRGQYLQSLYYERVSKANELFTGLIPGWQTDMGMIYIVFGPPQKRYLTGTTEKWVFSESVNNTEVTFTFSALEIIPGITYFHLDRNPDYERHWNRNVNKWRR